MKKKIGTILDEKLILKAKQIALSQNQSLSQLFENALKMYLLTIEINKEKTAGSITENTHGIMKIARPVLKAIMEEEGIHET